MASSAARRYAQAVLSLAKERGTLDAWLADLARLNELVTDPAAARFFANPNVPAAEKKDLLARGLADAQPEARNLAVLLAERGRLALVPDILRYYEQGRLAELGIALAEVTTAEPLTPREEALIRERLQRLVGKRIDLRVRIDPSLIGGIVARVGDRLIDGSVVSRLRRLRARLAAA